MKLALAFAQPLKFTGCAVISASVKTVSVAALEAVPVAEQLLFTIDLYWLLFIEVVTFAIFKLLLVAPLMFVKVAPPSVLICH